MENRIVSIEKLVSGGYGLSRSEGKIILVPFVLPEEEVKVKIVKTKTHFDIAEPTEIQKTSPNRISPMCSHYKICGGCHWQHIDYNNQISLKKEIIQETFSRIGNFEIQNLSVISGQPYGYRNRIQIQVNPLGQVGFMRRNSNEVVPIKKCPVIAPALNKLFSKPSFLPTKTKKIPCFSSISGDTYSALLQPQKKSIISLTIKGKTISFNLSCFFQSNLTLIEPFVEYITETERGSVALDLYCGVGLFSVFLQENFKIIIGVEENPKAVGFAKKNVPNSSCHFFKSSLEKLSLNELPIPIGPLHPIDLAVINPPRTGLTNKARENVIQMHISRLTYVSCNPDTLARDLKFFLKHGYKITDSRIFDFYPQTHHAECVVKLSKNDVS